MAVTTPFASIVAILSFEDDQVTVRLLASPGCTSAVICCVSPISKVVFAGDTVIISTNIVGGFTPREAFPCTPLPSLAVAVIVTVPAATAVANPFWSTVATSVSEEVQSSPWSVAVVGVISATYCTDAPISSIRLSGVNTICSTGMETALTSTVTEALSSLPTLPSFIV